MEPLDEKQQELLAHMVRNIDQMITEQYHKYNNLTNMHTVLDDSRRSKENV